MKRILFVQRPAGGGSATGLCEVIRALDRTKYEPIVLFHVPSRYRSEVERLGARTLLLTDHLPPERPERTGVRFVRKVARGRAASQWTAFLTRQLPRARALSALIRREEIDLVYQNNNPSSNRTSILAAHLAGVPQVAQVRFFARYYPPIDRRLATVVATFLYMSSAIEKQFQDALGQPAERGEVLYEPVDFDLFSADPRAGARIRAEFGFGADDLVVSTVGRLVPWKGQDVFLRALGRLSEAIPALKGLVVGAPGASRREKSYARRLRALAQRLGLADRVLFTGFRRDIPAVLAASDVVVHGSSRPEPFGRVVLEAMASGRPVVATDAGGVPEIVDHGVSGFLVPPGDPQRMAESIGLLLRDPDRRRTMGDAGRRRSRSRFAPDEFRRRLHTVLESVLRDSIVRPSSAGLMSWLAAPKGA